MVLYYNNVLHDYEISDKPSVLDIAKKIVEKENSSNNQNTTKEMAFTLPPSQSIVNPGSMINSISRNITMSINNM